MKPKRTSLFAQMIRRSALSQTILVSLCVAPAVQAQALYWDANAGEVGSGNQGGSWDIDTNWTEDSSGLTTPTVAWVDGSEAVFSAGTDGTGTWEVTVDGTVVTPSILLEESGAKTISGGTISIGGGTITTANAGNGNTVVISSVLSGTGGLTVNANGDLSDTGGGVGGRLELSGANDFIGDLTITGGLIRVDGGFGDAANKIVLSGGGLLDSNINFDLTRNLEIPAGKTGFYRTYGGVATGQISGPITGSGTLIRTDGGTLTLSGDGSAFTGTIVNARGNLYLTTNDWSGTTLRLTEGTNRLYVTAPGDTSILSFNSDRDVIVPFGSRLNIIDGTYTTVGAGPTLNGFWAQGTSAGDPAATGEITSSSGTLTLTNGAATGNLSTTDNQLRLKITDFGSGDNPSLAFVKNNQNSLTLDQPNTYTGGTTLNGGRLN
ncbi:MAG: autotransporter-associated beta strand repeat-containing protein, partial [Luteolibacter sp.]